MSRWYDFIYKDQATADRWNPLLDAERSKYYGSKTTQTVNRLEVIDYEKLFLECMAQGAEIIPCGMDDESAAMGGSVDDIKKVMFQTSDGDLNFIASCSCGHMRGNFNIGQKCPKCGSVVRTPFADEIQFQAWYEIPETLPPLLHPAVYLVLAKWMGTSKGKASIIDSILNVEAELAPQFKQYLGQGMTYFYNNFWDIVNMVATTKKGKDAETAEVMQYLHTYGQPDGNRPYGRLFTRHIPILNQSLHILTHSGSMAFSDESSQFILKTGIELGATIYQQRHQPAMSKFYLEQHIFSTYRSWLDYCHSIVNNKIIQKSGFIRKNTLGARIHMSARGVIVPITNPNLPDEVELPWRMVVGLFKMEIIGRLRQLHGLDINTAAKVWKQAQVGYDPVAPETPKKAEVREQVEIVKKCLEQLLAECPFKGFPIIMGRNPTLRHGAIQLFFCRHFKTDMTDDTIGMSPYSISCPNADFDGDALYLASIKEACCVIDLLAIHPICTLLGGIGDGLSPSVHMSDEMSIAMHGFLTDGGNLDIDKYYKAIYEKKAG